MSSLLQFNGKVQRGKGVQLQFVLEQKLALGRRKELDTFECPKCGRKHSFIYLAWRKPVGLFGQFVVFRYLGEEHPPDLSVPISVPKKPYGAVRTSVERSAEIWHS